MNENMEASHVLVLFLQIYLVFLNIFYVVSAKKCADIHCKVPISLAVAVEDHERFDTNYISFKKGDSLTIFSKYVQGTDNSIWQGSVQGAPAGFLRSSFVQERTIFKNDNELVNFESYSGGNAKPSENGELPGKSDESSDEMEDKGSIIEDVEVLENADDGLNGYPVVTPNSEDPSQTAHKHPADNHMLADKDNRELHQDKITNDNERTVKHSESESSPKDNMEDGSPHHNNKNVDPQVLIASNDKERIERTEVYTDPNGVQYDVKVEYLTPQDKGERVDVTSQSQIDADDSEKDQDDSEKDQDDSEKDQDDSEKDPDDVAKLNDHKENDDESEETPAKEKPSMERNEGFFSSVKTLVTDFADNVIKDFQGEDQQNYKLDKGKEEQDETEKHAEMHANSEKTDDKVEDQGSVKREDGGDESNKKTQEFNGFQAKFQQMKAARLNKMKESDKAARNDDDIPTKHDDIPTKHDDIPTKHDDIPTKDEILQEEILQEKAKKTVEGIPALMKDDGSESKETDNGSSKESEISSSQDSGEATEKQTRNYSDEMLCRSVSIEDREVCMESGSKEECLQDNCCFDWTAAPGKQCFFKPSTPESEQADNTPNVSDEPNETSDTELDSTIQSDNVDTISKDIENSAETKVTETITRDNGEVDSGREENAPAYKVAPSETVHHSSSSKQVEEHFPEAKNIANDDKDDDEDSVTDYEHIFEEKTKSVPEESDKDVKTADESADRNDVSNERGARVETQESDSHAMKDVNKKDEMTTTELDDDTASDSQPSSSNSKASMEKRDSSKVDITEDRNLQEQEKNERSEYDLKDDTSSEKDSSTKEEKVEIEYQRMNQVEATSNVKETVEMKDALEQKDPLKKDDVTTVKSKESYPGRSVSETARESVHNERKDESGDEHTKAPRQDSIDFSRPVFVVDDLPKEKREALGENEMTDQEIDRMKLIEGIMDGLSAFLPNGDLVQYPKSRDRSSDKIRNFNKVETPKREKNMKDNGEEYEGKMRSEPFQETNETTTKETETGTGEAEGIDKDIIETSASLEEKSSNTKDTVQGQPSVLDTETEDGKYIEEKTVESGSTHFPNNTEQTLPVEKTMKEKIDSSTSRGTEETKPGIEERKPGIELNIAPTKTFVVESSETIPIGQRPFEKKFPKIASKWMKNKLMKGESVATKDTEEDGSIATDVKMVEDLHSGTCTRDGTCEGTNTFSSRIMESNVDNDDISDLDDDELVESSLAEDKNVTGRTWSREMLAVSVRKFLEYHNIAADYGLPLLKPVMNVVKLLGEEMGLEETIVYVENAMEQGPVGVISVPLIMIAFATYFLLRFLCGKREPPCYGPNINDIFRMYKGRIRILERECTDYEEKLNNMRKTSEEDVKITSALEKQLDDEKHERNKSDEQISILKAIVKNLNEKVALLEEESANLKQSLDEKTGRINVMEEQLSVKSKEIETTENKIKQLDELLTVKDQEKNVLNENIKEYKKQLSKAEDDSDRHKTMLQDWNDRYHELQQKYDDISVSNTSLEEQIHFKDNEIEVLRDSLAQINNEVQVNSDEELSKEEMQETRSKKIKELMDVSQLRTDFKLCKEEKEKLDDDIKEAVNRREKLEGEVNQLEIDLAQSKASEEEIRFKYREADIKLNALQDYFKNMESELHRKLTAEEAARMASESELERKLREASTAVQDVELYRKQVEELRKEIDETQRAFRSQISSTEARAHENWLKFRSAERELEEMKRERDALRRRLYDLETSPRVSATSEDLVSSTAAENVESPVVRSESPATSVRSSKRKNSNSRKSPSGSPLDERKERGRRSRERNSPPSWDDRRRDKDRDTPPPPPPLWEPNMGPLPARRRGQRDSPMLPMDADIPRRRRDRYTPSPPPPPPPNVVPPPRRRRRDRRSPSSSPPPPPPAIFSPRGGMPVERYPPPPQFIRGGPPPVRGPFTRPPTLTDTIPSQPIGVGINGVSLDQSPPQGYIIRGRGPELSVNMQRPPPPPSGTSPGGNIPRGGGNMNAARQPLQTNISPSRGPQGGASYGQVSPYADYNIRNNTQVWNDSDSDKPPPPPVFANNGPYPRMMPPRRI